MKQTQLAVQPRAKQTKNANRRSRRAGRVPAVIYGGDQPPQPVLLNAVEFGNLLPKLHGMTIFNLMIDGADKAQQAIIRDVQRDPVSDRNILHVDFFRIQIDKPIDVEVMVHGIGGTPEGVKLGGVLETITRHVTVRCLPLEVPESFDLDISALMIGDSLHVSNITPPPGVEILSDRGLTVFAVSAPKMVEEAPAVKEGEEEAAPAEGAEAPAEEAEKAEKAE